MGQWDYRAIRNLVCIQFIICSFSVCYGQLPEIPEEKKYIRDVVYSGNGAIGDDRLNELLGTNPGQVFGSELIKGALPGILEEYRKLGYFFAKIGWKYEAIEKEIDVWENKLSLLQNMKVWLKR